MKLKEILDCYQDDVIHGFKILQLSFDFVVISFVLILVFIPLSILSFPIFLIGYVSKKLGI